MSNLTDLQYELLADPLGRGYSGMTDDQAAASLDTVDISVIDSIPIANVEAYLLSDGTLIRLEDYLTANPTPGPLNTAVAALLRVISSQRLTVFQIETKEAYAGFNQQLQALVQANLLTAQQATDLLNMAVTMVSRAQQIGWPQGVSSADVKVARS